MIVNLGDKLRFSDILSGDCDVCDSKLVTIEVERC